MATKTLSAEQNLIETIRKTVMQHEGPVTAQEVILEHDKAYPKSADGMYSNVLEGVKELLGDSEGCFTRDEAHYMGDLINDIKGLLFNPEVMEKFVKLNRSKPEDIWKRLDRMQFFMHMMTEEICDDELTRFTLWGWPDSFDAQRLSILADHYRGKQLAKAVRS